MITLPYCPPGGNLFFTPSGSRGNNEEAQDKWDDSSQHTARSALNRAVPVGIESIRFSFYSLMFKLTCPFCLRNGFFTNVWVQRVVFHRRWNYTSWNVAGGGLLHRRTLIIALQTFSVGTFPVSSKSPGLAELLIWFVRDDVNWFHSSVARLSTAGATLAGVCSEQNVRCMKKTAAAWSVSCTGVNCRGRQNNV